MNNNRITNLIDVGKIFNSEDKKRLLSNFLSLSVLQGANYILPLITLPYLVRVLGPSKYGLIAFAQAFIQYFNILTDYGFNLSATREISIHRDNKEKVSEIFSSVMIIKLVLLILSFIIMTVIVFSFEKFRKDWLIYYFTFGMVIGQVLFPVWFFQGMERMKYITILNITAKLIFTVSIFVFIRKMSDYIYVPLVNSIGFCIAGIMAILIIHKNFNLNLIYPGVKTLKYQLKKGWHIFIARVAVITYTSGNTFILGVFTNSTTVGYYTIAEKLTITVSSLGNIMNQTTFPYLSNIWKIDKRIYYSKAKKVLLALILVMTLLLISIFTFSNIIIKLLTGRYLQESISILKILSPVVLLFPLGGFFTQAFISQGKSEYVSKVTFLTMVTNFIIVLILINLFKAYGLAYSVLIVQIFHLILNYTYFRRLRLKCVE